MYFDGSYRFIGKVDPEPLVAAIRSLGEDPWFEYVRRQETYEVHRRTQTIPLLFDEDARHTDPTEWPRLQQLQAVIEPVLDKIREANADTAENGDKGYFIRIILTRLSPHGWITRHRDRGDTFMRSHRNHIAIITDPGVEFEVDEQVQHFAPGEIWEINNRQLHTVRNRSDIARVHLIVDYVVPGERIEDPEGVLVG
jgi:quercetin dioxygenase-like cupin family protein